MYFVQMFCTPVQYSEPPEGYFCLWFLEKIPSRYTSAFSFKSCLQEDIVCRRLDDDDRMHEAEESMIVFFLRILFTMVSICLALELVNFELTFSENMHMKFYVSNSRDRSVYVY